MKIFARVVLLSLMPLISACSSDVPSSNKIVVNYDADKAAIWELEKTIYEKRSVGDIEYYIANSNPEYLGWPFGLDEPANLDVLETYASEGRFKPGENLVVTSDGISVEGHTAVSYFSTHRTQKPGGDVVDEKYQNIHVWAKRDGNWTLIGSFSRKIL